MRPKRLRARTDGSPWLWIRVERGARDGRLTDKRVNAIWRELAEQLGVPHWSSHQLRHTAATAILEAGGTELDVQQQLGHATLQTVHRYTQVRQERRRQLVNRGIDDLVKEPAADGGYRRPGRSSLGRIYRQVRRG